MPEHQEPIPKEYDGLPVVGASVAIRNTGHGFENLLAADPVKMRLGSKRFVVLEVEVEKHRFEPSKDADDELILVNMLKAGDRATFVDRDLVEDLLEEHARRVAEAKGEPMLDFPEGDYEGPDIDGEPEDGFGLYDGSLEEPETVDAG